MTTQEDEERSAQSDEENTLDMEMALLALSASGDVGGPLQEIDLNTLSVEEKRALLAYLRHRFHLAPDLEELSECLGDCERHDGTEEGSLAPSNKSSE